ncbi:hypothetical protein EVAR_57240_1 [Eumeta japonica]|uniref:Uncharacterized protein n=1 Tax=Eumeta variegata TaxID=151549 RepID=A0A4C1ZFC2_EUMVA|nr:hypothetical protein EVAR_57240_1 [Eumeta japonica]
MNNKKGRVIDNAPSGAESGARRVVHGTSVKYSEEKHRSWMKKLSRPNPYRRGGVEKSMSYQFASPLPAPGGEIRPDRVRPDRYFICAPSVSRFVPRVFI